jgi:hypothetical protein
VSVRPPAPRPCESCPYRRNVPSGVWVAEEYAKLPAYDRPTAEQPAGLFLCHQQDGRACAGWAGCHDMSQSLALRFASISGVPAETIDALLDYVSPVPLWPTGVAAAEHGMTEVDAPGDTADRLIGKLVRRRDDREKGAA